VTFFLTLKFRSAKHAHQKSTYDVAPKSYSQHSKTIFAFSVL
jgi:hypothetical protein